MMAKSEGQQGAAGSATDGSKSKVAMKIVERLGSGGMGDVFLCQLGKELVAVKRLQHSVLRRAKKPAKIIERFRREAMAGMMVQHPSLVSVRELVELDKYIYLVMDYVEGATLEIAMQERLPFDQVLRWATSICEGLAALHQANIIHRDVKPSNVLIEQHSKRARLIDYGLARVLDAKTITTSPQIMGTPGYMAPEQARDHRVDARADLYSFGVLLYHVMSGHNPFAARNMAAIGKNILSYRPEPLQSFMPDVPPAFSKLVEQLLEKDPALRPGSAKEVLTTLLGIRFADYHFDVGKPEDMDKLVIGRSMKTLRLSKSKP